MRRGRDIQPVDGSAFLVSAFSGIGDYEPSRLDCFLEGGGPWRGLPDLPFGPQQDVEGFPSAGLGLMPITHISEVMGTMLAKGGSLLAPREGLLKFGQAACIRVPILQTSSRGL